jgi:hypothetical protein
LDLLEAHLGSLIGSEGVSHHPSLVSVFVTAHAGMTKVQVVPKELIENGEKLEVAFTTLEPQGHRLPQLQASVNSLRCTIHC